MRRGPDRVAVPAAGRAARSGLPVRPGTPPVWGRLLRWVGLGLLGGVLLGFVAGLVRRQPANGMPGGYTAPVPASDRTASWDTRPGPAGPARSWSTSRPGVWR